MPEHYTQGTVGATKWCNRCARQTLHSVSGNRIGRCTEHDAPHITKAQQKRRDELERRQQNPTLFPDQPEPQQ